MHIKTKMPYKSAAEINDVMSKKINGEMTYEECEDLVRYLYNKIDANEILAKLQQVFIERQKKDPSQQPKRRGINNETINTSGRGKI